VGLGYHTEPNIPKAWAKATVQAYAGHTPYWEYTQHPWCWACTPTPLVLGMHSSTLVGYCPSPCRAYTLLGIHPPPLVLGMHLTTLVGSGFHVRASHPRASERAPSLTYLGPSSMPERISHL
jgi:hypothetical protein